MTLPGFHACQMCMGTGGVRIPCAFCRRGDPVHPHVCAECGGAGQVPSPETVERVEAWLRADMETDNWEMGVAMEPGGFMRAALLEYARHVQG